jgi:general secretion pathway protein K
MTPCRPPLPQPATQRGAAMLLALLILTLVSTLAAGMVWQQWRTIQVESAERARTQAAWILSGALDWARLILREDARERGGADHLGEPWAVPLAEARLSTFLAADRENNSLAENDSLDAFLSGSITDAQARWNLRRLVDGSGKLVPAELLVLERLCATAGVPGDTAGRIAAGLVSAWAPAASAAGSGAASEQAVLAPQRVWQLTWLGLDPDTVERLEPWIVLLPNPDATVNVLTAPAEVIAAAVEGMSAGAAQRLVRERGGMDMRGISVERLRGYFPAEAGSNLTGIGVASRYFIVRGRLRLGERVLEERSLVERRQLEIQVLMRERLNLRDGP